METLLPAATRIAELLRRTGATLAVSESSTGGLISAALLAVPGASAYFLGGAVVYTGIARAALLDIGPAEMHGLRSASERYAQLLARTTRTRFASSWALAETGAAGPSGNRYGDTAGHCCLAVEGERVAVVTLETGLDDRVANMRRFAAAALELLERSLAQP
jgi:nicotinamide-nucleotide amidase